LTNGPKFFQKEISKLFCHLKFVKVFIDDVLVFSNSEFEHNQHLEIVFKILEDNNLRLNLQKSKFFLKEVEFLGLKISSDGIKLNSNKLTELTKYIHPKNKKDLMRLLGFITWFR